MDLHSLPIVAPGPSALQLRTHWLVGWWDGHAAQEGIGSMTLVSLALLPGQLNGLGSAVSPDYIHSLRHHFIYHEPLVSREKSQTVAMLTQIYHQCWSAATSLLRLESGDVVLLSSHLFLDQAGFLLIFKNTIACMWLFSLYCLSGQQGEGNLWANGRRYDVTYLGQHCYSPAGNWDAQTWPSDFVG